MWHHLGVTSMVLCHRMARTRGGMIRRPAVPPRIFTNKMGVKVRKLNGGYVYQPVSLKVSSYLTLDRHFPDSKNRNLFENIQKCLDNLVSRVEERIMGIEPTGMREGDGNCIALNRFARKFPQTEVLIEM